jgi:signal transduction histidine kinase/integral membrane sensor domain MASE1
MRRLVLLNVCVAVAYVAAARLGFHVAFAAEQISTVWPPSGIAMASMILGGLSLAPGVWLGAFLANAGMHAPLWSAACIAAGNTFEAAIARWMLRRFDVDPGLGTVGAAAAFIGLGAVAATMTSATVGVLALSVAHVQPWWRFPSLWFDWWLGDALGVLVVAPAMLTLAHARWSSRDRIEAVLFTGGSVIVAQFVFGNAFGAARDPIEYGVFPLLIAAAMRGNQASAMLALVGTSAVAIANTALGAGPFAGASLHHSLILLQLFTGVAAVTTLLLAAGSHERHQTVAREAAAGQALRGHEAMLRLAQRAGHIGTFEWDFQAGMATCSEEFFRLFALPYRDGGISTAEWGTFIHPDDRDAMAAHLQRVIRGQEPAAADYRIVAADGRTRWLSYVGRIERTAHGDRMLGVVMDVTARKRDEIALREAKAAAETTSLLKDEFLAMLSHELRTPLAAVLGYARLLQMGALSGATERRAIEVIERNAQAQARLVDELLDMSRIAAGRVPLERRPVAPAAVVREALDGVVPQADGKQIDVRIDVDDDVPMVAGDAARLRQVLSNLATNAIKFTPAGGRVTVTARGADGHVEIAIADTGIGIAPEFLPFVFEPFRQAETKFDGARSGLGLGLALSRRLIELHGGTIEAASAGLGCGATFSVRLPISEPDGDARADGRA